MNILNEAPGSLKNLTYFAKREKFIPTDLSLQEFLSEMHGEGVSEMRQKYVPYVENGMIDPEKALRRNPVPAGCLSVMDPDIRAVGG